MKLVFLLLMSVCLSPLYVIAQNLPRLKVSPNGHYLQTDIGKPFFYLGDTAWELFHRLNREDALLYLKDRADKGYNVIQAVALAEAGGVTVPNAYGYFPLDSLNPATPACREGEENDYWDHVDYIIGAANELGLYVGLLPTWGSWWSDENSIFNVMNAEEYGRWIASRYAEYNVIWILGGDRNPDTPLKRQIVQAMAYGIRSKDGRNLMTFHPAGWQTSSEWFHHDEWLSFNSRQSSHHQRYNSNSRIWDDFQRTPSKPVLELEPLYEDHPLEFKPDNEGYSCAWDVRRALYWSLFYGAAGVTYGHHSVWQMYEDQKGFSPINNPIMSWREALNRPAARQAIHLKRLMESRPYFSRVPASHFIVEDNIPMVVPGAGRYRLVATMDAHGTYAMVYTPISRSFSVNTSMIKGKELVAWWYSPRTGEAKKIGKFVNDVLSRTFTPPAEGEALDWVLVIDDVQQEYPAPGGVWNDLSFQTPLYEKVKNE